ncbi:lipopolysaccharide-induced tumor necrosis factor-alpha factor homolog [Hetaerina americana]|uniref:lipopolysaccharide-induced tumor necrosis factor-alpha factor homolog n=1 Tax=Hetaerina americana TaxID=62018 RepID=UPI003A7F17B1
MSSGGGSYPPLPPQYGESQSQQHGIKPPAYGHDASLQSHSAMTPGQQPATIAVIQTTAAIPLGPEAAHITCPSCRASVATKVVHENTTKTHIICLILCLVGLWPCCVIPYCVNSCKNANHYCPTCNAFLGTYKG